ncbi:MAG: hypothetical protein MI974_32430 [Chitinophagales bacterium]|nr:hypothetical protein [Chitinophagales bacterium]
MRAFSLLLNLFLTYALTAQISLTEYTEFLRQKHLSPKEYVLSLFEHNDIVIIGERDHRDTTQYDLILDIIADDRFIQNVGHVYTEVGVINQTGRANEVLKEDYPNDQAFETALIDLYRAIDFNPLWTKYNMYKYLKGIYNINKELSLTDKITIGLTDASFSWEGMTAERLEAFHKVLSSSVSYRDSIMADNFMRLYEKQVPINNRKKALLIQSRPHAINLDILDNNKHRKKTGSYIVDKYKEAVKIIAFAWYKYKPDSEITLTDIGKWDAAFQNIQHKAVGFDIKDSPFGLAPFDFYPDHHIRFDQIIDGLIFYVPFYEWACTSGIPNVIDDDFYDEIVKREKMAYGDDIEINRADIFEYYNNVRSVECIDYQKFKQIVDNINK